MAASAFNALRARALNAFVSINNCSQSSWPCGCLLLSPAQLFPLSDREWDAFVYVDWCFWWWETILRRPFIKLDAIARTGIKRDSCLGVWNDWFGQEHGCEIALDVVAQWKHPDLLHFEDDQWLLHQIFFNLKGGKNSKNNLRFSALKIYCNMNFTILVPCIVTFYFIYIFTVWIFSN